MNAKDIKSGVMFAAWRMVHSDSLTLSQALKAAWADYRRDKVIRLLRTASVALTFRKVDGTVTTRVATLKPELIPAELQAKGTKIASPAVVTFYSVTDQGWRSAKNENILSFFLA